MHAKRLFRGVAVPLLVMAAAVTGPATASAVPGSPFVPGADLQVSGPSTLTGCTAGASDGFATAYDNTEVEPQVAVNPTNPNEMVGWRSKTVGRMVARAGSAPGCRWMGV
jgi:ABC-type phosphate transport system substrate-binding protein